MGIKITGVKTRNRGVIDQAINEVSRNSCSNWRERGERRRTISLGRRVSGRLLVFVNLSLLRSLSDQPTF